MRGKFHGRGFFSQSLRFQLCHANPVEISPMISLQASESLQLASQKDAGGGEALSFSFRM